MIMVVGNGHSDTISNPDDADYISQRTNTLRKGIKPIIFPPVIVK